MFAVTNLVDAVVSRYSVETYSAFAVASGAASIAVEALGDGLPVVLLHAGVADRRMWGAQVGALAAAGFRAIAYDRRGFGETLHADDEYSQVGDLVAVLDRRLPDAVSAGFTGCRIIHGKGTGVLRREVRKYLETHPLIRSQRLGGWTEGDTGVTIVEFK